MPAKRVLPPPVRSQVVAHSAGTPEGAERMIDSLAEQLALLKQRTRSVVDADLVVGANRINHQLGRKPSGCNLTPTDADASFAWALTEKDTRQAVITVVGVDQPGATLEFW